MVLQQSIAESEFFFYPTTSPYTFIYPSKWRDIANLESSNSDVTTA